MLRLETPRGVAPPPPVRPKVAKHRIWARVKLLKVNPGTQIWVSPPLSRDTEQSHYLIDPPPQKGVIKFVKF